MNYIKNCNTQYSFSLQHMTEFKVFKYIVIHSSWFVDPPLTWKLYQCPHKVLPLHNGWFKPQLTAYTHIIIHFALFPAFLFFSPLFRQLRDIIMSRYAVQEQRILMQKQRNIMIIHNDFEGCSWACKMGLFSISKRNDTWIFLYIYSLFFVMSLCYCIMMLE